MNWQLIRSSPTWRIAAWASLIYALSWLAFSQGDRTGVAMSAPLLVWVGYVMMASREPQIGFRCTFFEAALPIPGRQLWVSKRIILLGLIWMPALVASGVGFAVLRDPALPLLEATAGLTVIFLFATSFGIRQFHEPRRICYASLIVGGLAMMAIARVLPDSAWVLAAYLLVSAVLFVLTWRRVPSSFQVATAELVVTKPVNAKAASRSPVWWRILRPIYYWQLLMVAFGVFLWWTGGMMALVVYLGAAFVAVATKFRWRFMAHLPVSARTVFRATWGPYAIVVLGSYEAALHLTRDSRTVATTLALGVGLLLAFIFTFHAADWRRLRSLPTALRWSVGWIIPLALGFAWPDFEVWHKYGNDPIPYFVLQLSGMLPANPWLLAATLLIPLAGLYWLAERSFCETEYIALVRPAPAEDYQANFQR